MASSTWEKSDLEWERHKEDSEEGSWGGSGSPQAGRPEAGKSRVPDC